MSRNVEHDECLICEDPLIIGIDLYRLLIKDSICYQCRRLMNGKFKKTKYLDYPLYYFYDYNDVVSKLLIRYKDYLDVELGSMFMKPYYAYFNLMFKDYTIVPVPSSDTMRSRRGFEHLTLMLKDCRMDILDCLSKQDQIQRFQQVRQKQTFSFKEVPTSLDKVIIFDDVISTGSSIDATLELLKPLVNDIVIICLINNLS